MLSFSITIYVYIYPRQTPYTCTQNPPSWLTNTVSVLPSVENLIFLFPSVQNQMARSLPSAMLLAASVVDGLSVAINRRGYAAASRGAAAVGKGGSRSGMVVGKPEETAVIKEKSWAPDPVTGYYKPNDRAAEIDAVELREMALNHKVTPH
ncbi:hypothetical protein F0562_034845 [Nyssa sinensis]|uniref:Uncharacterized protein n=1 Tax=Nyssa sinensis TaxID=561372 RepID=A0A5J5AA82_9ASTE|nr:hypothetical protein F0562_034845 [Nyssa sinensis]